MDSAFLRPGANTGVLREWLEKNANTVFTTDPHALPHPSSLELHPAVTIGLFGTSANPPHKGHASMIQYFTSERVGLNEIWILPVCSHMFTSKQSNLLPFEHRLKMCSLAFEPLSTSTCRVRVLAVEQVALRAAHELSGKERIGTAAILRFLRFIYGPRFVLPVGGDYENPTQNPDVNFSLLLGMDSYGDLKRGKWLDSSYIMGSTRLHVVARAGVDSSTTGSISADEKDADASGSDVTVHSHDAGGYSSTNIRAFFSQKLAPTSSSPSSSSSSSSPSSAATEQSYFEDYLMYPPEEDRDGDGKGDAQGTAQGGPADVPSAVLQYIVRGRLYRATSSTTTTATAPTNANTPASTSNSASAAAEQSQDPVSGNSVSNSSSGGARTWWIYYFSGAASVAFLLSALTAQRASTKDAGGAPPDILFLSGLPRVVTLGARWVRREAVESWRPDELLRRFSGILRSAQQP